MNHLKLDTGTKLLRSGDRAGHLLEGKGIEVQLVGLALRALVGDHEGDGICLPVRVALASELRAVIYALHLEAHPAGAQERVSTGIARWKHALTDLLRDDMSPS